MNDGEGTEQREEGSGKLNLRGRDAARAESEIFGREVATRTRYEKRSGQDKPIVGKTFV